MRLVYDRSAEVAAWVSRQIPQMHGQGFGDAAKAIGVETADGKPLGGVVFTNWAPWYGSIELHFASAGSRWLTRNLVRSILAYPFDQLDCARVTGVTPSRAASALRFLNKFGFKREGLVRMGFGDDDAVISGLLKDEWLNSRFASRPPELSIGQAARTDPARPAGDRGGAVHL